MEMVPRSVGRCSRDWDEQHLDLASAAAAVRDAGTSGLTDEVAGAAEAFLGAWHRMLDDLATSAEEQADGLRDTVADWLVTDRASSVDALRLASYVVELR